MFNQEIDLFVIFDLFSKVTLCHTLFNCLQEVMKNNTTLIWARNQKSNTELDTTEKLSRSAAYCAFCRLFNCVLPVAEYACVVPVRVSTLKPIAPWQRNTCISSGLLPVQLHSLLSCTEISVWYSCLSGKGEWYWTYKGLTPGDFSDYHTFTHTER